MYIGKDVIKGGHRMDRLEKNSGSGKGMYRRVVGMCTRYTTAYVNKGIKTRAGVYRRKG